VKYSIVNGLDLWSGQEYKLSKKGSFIWVKEEEEKLYGAKVFIT
jgi:hypothetical protein